MKKRMYLICIAIALSSTICSCSNDESKQNKEKFKQALFETKLENYQNVFTPFLEEKILANEDIDNVEDMEIELEALPNRTVKISYIFLVDENYNLPSYMEGNNVDVLENLKKEILYEESPNYLNTIKATSLIFNMVIKQNKDILYNNEIKITQDDFSGYVKSENDYANFTIGDIF